jgi:uncharacterized 2Fe-2S/4Fe-4S cluster protein (DUF4445 family)
MKITFLPKNISWEGPEGPDLMTIAAQVGIIMDGSCGGKGICGKCRVLIDGRSELACTYIPTCDLTVELPDDEVLAADKISMSKLPRDFTPRNGYGSPDAGDGPALGLAFDVGTTTVVGALYDMRDATCLGMLARTNPQGIYGADVISRIQFVSESEKNAGLDVLHNLIANCLTDIGSRLVKSTGHDLSDLVKCVLCGNTTMSHLAVGKNPTALAIKPFAPAYTGTYICKATEVGIDLNGAMMFYAMPNIAGHVGGDITANIVALRKRITGTRTLLIDIGTNGEVFCSNGAREACCSTAAGPAFEGATIQMGMRAADGAMERVSVNGEGKLETRTIGNVDPVGICGSGIIDAMAMLAEHGIVQPSGRFSTIEELRAQHTSDDLIRRVRASAKTGRPEFVLAFGDNRPDVVISQQDVREVQLGKAALSAGIALLMRHLDLGLDELDHLFVAGAFGNHIDLAAAQRIGLLPPCDPAIVEFVGNAAIIGTSMCLLDDSLLDGTHDLVAGIEHVEIAEDDSFQRTYLKAMSFEI